MDKSKIIVIGKWAAIIILASGNFLAYTVNKTTLNLVLTALVFLYSIYEFFQSLSGKKLHIGLKMYLFTFYMFGVISLFMGLQSLLADQFTSSLISFALIAGDIALILYSIHKFSHIE